MIQQLIACLAGPEERARGETRAVQLTEGHSVLLTSDLERQMLGRRAVEDLAYRVVPLLNFKEGISIHTLMAILGSYSPAVVVAGLVKALNLGEVIPDPERPNNVNSVKVRYRHTDFDRVVERMKLAEIARHEEMRRHGITVITIPNNEIEMAARAFMEADDERLRAAGVNEVFLESLRLVVDVGTGKTEVDTTHAEAYLRKVGEALNAAGGLELMQIASCWAVERTDSLHARTLEIIWDGIGEWLG